MTQLAISKKLSSGVSVEAVTASFSLAAGWFLAGVFMTIAALTCFALAKLKWGGMWEARATLQGRELEISSRWKARAFEALALLLLGVALFSFVPGSYYATTAFAH
jgi:hypothetical protein